jgi:hypothetical protein
MRAEIYRRCASEYSRRVFAGGDEPPERVVLVPRHASARFGALDQAARSVVLVPCRASASLCSDEPPERVEATTSALLRGRKRST